MAAEQSAAIFFFAAGFAQPL
jgi:hypothetical protein